MKSYIVPLTCPRCGVPMDHVNGARQNEIRATAVAGCQSCHCEFTVTVRVEQLPRPR